MEVPISYRTEHLKSTLEAYLPRLKMQKEGE